MVLDFANGVRERSCGFFGFEREHGHRAELELVARHLAIGFGFDCNRGRVSDELNPYSTDERQLDL